MNSYYMLSFVVDGFFMMTSFVIWSFCKHTVLHFGHTAAYSLQFHTNRFFLSVHLSGSRWLLGQMEMMKNSEEQAYTLVKKKSSKICFTGQKLLPSMESHWSTSICLRRMKLDVQKLQQFSSRTVRHNILLH